jgi:hypothetical protein
VDGAQAKLTVQFDQADESDGVTHPDDVSFPFYPVPDEAITLPHWIEGGDPGNIDERADQDRHLLMVDRDNRHLYELYNVYYDGAGWQAYSGAFFDLNTNDRRPEGWTSADAAGLAILPGLVRWDEVYGEAEIRHAFRFTVRHTKGTSIRRRTSQGRRSTAPCRWARGCVSRRRRTSRASTRGCRRSSAR